MRQLQLHSKWNFPNLKFTKFLSALLIAVAQLEHKLIQSFLILYPSYACLAKAKNARTISEQLKLV